MPDQLNIYGEPMPILEPEPSGQHEQDKLFEPPETTPGQLALDLSDP